MSRRTLSWACCDTGRDDDEPPYAAGLRANVHEFGSLLATDELLERNTGHGPEAGSFLAHLRAHYLP